MSRPDKLTQPASYELQALPKIQMISVKLKVRRESRTIPPIILRLGSRWRRVV
jgi:hypothetical protein